MPLRKAGCQHCSPVGTTTSAPQAPAPAWASSRRSAHDRVGEFTATGDEAGGHEVSRLVYDTDDYPFFIELVFHTRQVGIYPSTYFHSLNFSSPDCIQTRSSQNASHEPKRPSVSYSHSPSNLRAFVGAHIRDGDLQPTS